jgi:hypothetical protein
MYFLLPVLSMHHAEKLKIRDGFEKQRATYSQIECRKPLPIIINLRNRESCRRYYHQLQNFILKRRQFKWSHKKQVEL